MIVTATAHSAIYSTLELELPSHFAGNRESSDVPDLYRVASYDFRVPPEEAVASDIEIERIRKDTETWRALARSLVGHTAQDELHDNELDFLEQLLERRWLEELSYRQAEWLLDIRDNTRRIGSYRGFSLRTLIRRCNENRFDLDDEDQVWISGLYQEGSEVIRLRQARRVFALAQRLGEVDRAP